MANKYGRLGATANASGSFVLLYQVPTESVATVTVSACNNTGSATNIYVALSLSGSTEPNVGDYLEYEYELLGNEVLERTGIVMGSEDILYVQSSQASSSFVAFGIQEDV